MIKNTRNTIVVFSFVVMLMAMPLATNAFAASGGSGVINPTCGITEPATINVGAFNRGSDGTQTLTEIVTTGSVTGTFEVIMTDWVGTGAKAENSILVGTPVAATDVLTINGLGYQAVVTPSAAGDFAVNANPITTASNLVTVINADGRAGVTESGIDIVATSFDNAVFLRADIVEADGNNIGIANSAGTGLPVQGATAFLTGGEDAGVKHMDAEDTHFAITTDESTVSNSYAAKSALSATGVNQVLSTTTNPSPTKDIFWYLHLSGVDDKATGTVTMTADIADGDIVAINGVNYVAEVTLPLDALEFDIATGATVNLDAAALKTAIDLNTADTRYTTAIDNAVITMTAVKPGEGENAILLTQTGDGVTVSGSGTFTGGDDNLEALPFTGGITTTATFGTRC